MWTRLKHHSNIVCISNCLEQRQTRPYVGATAQFELAYPQIVGRVHRSKTFRLNPVFGYQLRCLARKCVGFVGIERPFSLVQQLADSDKQVTLGCPTHLNP